jgi:hypothetical protein
MAIADPPYLGRAVRWYGGGRASGAGRHRPDVHPDAAEWDRPERHAELVRQLRADFGAWAIAATPASLPVYLAAAPDVRVLVWHRRNAPPSGARVRACWEPVLVSTPRRGRGSGVLVDDVLDVAGIRAGFVGAKPARWTRWVLDVLGYDAETDEVVDLFAGSGSVSAELLQGVLPIGPA